MTNNNASPAPSRVLRPRPSTLASKKAMSNTGEFSTSILSPVNSQEGTVAYTPDSSTYLDTSPVSSPTMNGQNIDASMMAVRGSVPPSPVLRARRGLKDSSFFNMPKMSGKEWDDEKVQEELAKSSSIDESVELELTPNGEIVRTANTGRVIAIDCDVILPPSQAQVGDGRGDSSLEQSFISLTESSEIPLSPTERKGATSGLLLALKQLQALGHPLHLITDIPVAERGQVIDWLTSQGISIGTKDQDIVAALWSVDTADLDPGMTHHIVHPRGARNGDVQKLKILRAMNAALYLCKTQETTGAIAMASPRIPIIQFTQSPTHSEDVEPDLSEKNQDSPAPTGGNIGKLHKWTEVVAWVRAWDGQ